MMIKFMKRYYWFREFVSWLKREEKQRCPRREEHGGDHYANPKRVLYPDKWRKVGPNRCCSFCGSIHPLDFEMIFDKAIAGEKGYEVDPSTKGYKYYVRQPDVINAGDGGIKFYTMHIDQQSKEWLDKLNDKYLAYLKKKQDEAEKTG